MGAITEFFAAILVWFFEIALPNDPLPLLPSTPEPNPYPSFTLTPGFTKNWRPLVTSTPLSRDSGRPKLIMGSRDFEVGSKKHNLSKHRKSKSPSYAPVYGCQAPMVQYLQQWKVNEIKYSPYVPYKCKKTQAARLRL